MLVKKYCQKCQQYSFSSWPEGKWLCPTCGNDLTNEPVMNINEPAITRMMHHCTGTNRPNEAKGHLTLVHSEQSRG